MDHAFQQIQFRDPKFHPRTSRAIPQRICTALEWSWETQLVSESVAGLSLSTWNSSFHAKNSLAFTTADGPFAT